MELLIFFPLIAATQLFEPARTLAVMRQGLVFSAAFEAIRVWVTWMYNLCTFFYFVQMASVSSSISTPSGWSGPSHCGSEQTVQVVSGATV